MNDSKDILKELKLLSNNQKREFFPKFFKTGKGEYGEGDIFWGVTVPNIRAVAKKYYKEISLEQLKEILNHPVHEVRLTGYIILTYKFETGDMEGKECIVAFYLDNLKGVNNWDIVDLSSYKILGEYLVLKPEMKSILYKLVDLNDLWKQRIAIVSTYSFIKRNEFEDTLKISKILLSHNHDLIHKAVGWMLREVGKRDIDILREFLNRNIENMPRTTIRYAIEKMDKKERERYLRL